MEGHKLDEPIGKCPACGRAAAVNAFGGLWAHLAATASGGKVLCPGIKQWNRAVGDLRHAGLDATEPRYDVIDTRHGTIEASKHGRMWAVRTADMLNRGEVFSNESVIPSRWVVRKARQVKP